jgi:2-haloacid dehalogenase
VTRAGLSEVRALTFDVFGTTVDWLSGVAGEARRLGGLNGVDVDWKRLAGAWRALYMPSMDRVRRGELPWTNFDRLHRMSLDQVLREGGAEGFDPAAREELTRAWERLPAWPDSAPGLERLASRYTVPSKPSSSNLLTCPSSASFPPRTSTTTSPTPRCTWAPRQRLAWRRTR